MTREKICDFQKELFSALTTNYKFIVDEVTEDKNIFIALKYINTFAYVVCISTQYNYRETYSLVKRHLEAKENINSFNIHNIILSKTNDLEVENLDFNYPIVIDVINRQVLSYSDESEPVKRVLDYIFTKPVKKKTSLLDKVKILNKKTPSVTKTLIYFNIFIFVVTVCLSAYMNYGFLNSIIEINPTALYIVGAKVNTLIINDLQWWRLITAMFLHGGIVHLAFNLYALYILGTQFEIILGKEKFIIVYLISGLIGNISSLIFSKNMSVGASGAIFGLLGVMLIFSYLNKKNLDQKLFTNTIFIILFNLMIGFTLGAIDNAAHIGGLLAGIVLTSIIYRKKIIEGRKLNMR